MCDLALASLYVVTDEYWQKIPRMVGVYTVSDLVITGPDRETERTFHVSGGIEICWYTCQSRNQAVGHANTPEKARGSTS